MSRPSHWELVEAVRDAGVRAIACQEVRHAQDDVAGFNAALGSQGWRAHWGTPLPLRASPSSLAGPPIVREKRPLSLTKGTASDSLTSIALEITKLSLGAKTRELPLSNALEIESSPS